jgi:hypothetical protein
VAVKLLVLLYAHPEGQEALRDFEDQALVVLADFAESVERYMGPSILSGEGDPPAEVHLVTFASRERFDAYRADSRTAELARERDAAIARTVVLELRT